MPSNDIFGYIRKDPSSVFSADLAKLTISGAEGKEMSVESYLVQNWNVTYRHDLQEIYEIGSSNLYWVKGHPIGNGTLGRIIGGRKNENADSVRFFSKDAYDMCKGGVAFDIKMTPGVCSLEHGQSSLSASAVSTPIVLGLKGCVVTQIGFTINAQDVKITEDLQFRFASLELT